MTDAIVEISGLRVDFTSDRRKLSAVDGVDISIDRGAALGIVGESGCGKTTLARAIAGLVEPSGGAIRLDGVAVSTRRNASTRRRIQMVFQDPGSSLNPRMTVKRMLAELLRVHRLVPRSQIDDRCAELLDLVELPTRLFDSYPRSLSGGQRQRVAIARALAVEPDVLIADEAVSALDVSVQAGVLNLLSDLRERLGLTLVFITHDLAVVRNVCERIAVMYLGRVVEEAEAEQLFTDPRHPYTQALIAAVPKFAFNADAGGLAVLPGEPPSPLDVPTGCRFRPRCPLVQPVCSDVDPALADVNGHRAACLFAWETTPQR